MMQGRKYIKLVVVFGGERWLLMDMDRKRLNAWERNILMRIYGPMGGQVIWRIRTNQEFLELYKDLDSLGAGLNGDRIPLGRDFPQPSRPSLGPNRPPVQRVSGPYGWRKAARA